MTEVAAPIRVVTGVDRLERDDERLLFAVGVFDGLHRGHRYLLARLRRHAERLRARPAVITFDAHPDAVIVGHAPPLLVDPEERLGRLARAGVAVTVVQHFDDALRRTPYDTFVRAIAERTRLAGFLMTPDAAFGHERRGTPGTLGDLGRSLGYEVIVVPPYQLDGGPVRSARIRECIAVGDLVEATRLLGRGVAVTGTTASAAIAPASAAAAGETGVSFTMPVALPPDGRYRTVIEAPWSREGPGRGTARRAMVAVSAGSLHVIGDPVVPATRVRLRFVERA